VFDKIKIVRAWDSTLHVVTGVPPHIKELVDLEALQKEQSELTDKVYKKVMHGLRQYFEVRGIGGGKMTEARIRVMISEGGRQTAKDLVHKIEEKLDLLATSFDAATGSGRVALQRNGQFQQQETYSLPTNTLGQLTRLPDDFQFPKGNAFDCWNQWNIRNKERQIPPLRLVNVREYQFWTQKPNLMQRNGGREEFISTKGVRVGKYAQT
jgi:hypothetical protein